MGRGVRICIGPVNGASKNGKNCKKWRKSAIFCTFCVWIMYSFTLCGAFLVLVYGIGGSDRFSEIVRSVSLVVICGYNTGRAQMHRLWRAARTPPFFLCAQTTRITGKNLAVSTQGSDYKKAHNVYYV